MVSSATKRLGLRLRYLFHVLSDVIPSAPVLLLGTLQYGTPDMYHTVPYGTVWYGTVPYSIGYTYGTVWYVWLRMVHS